ncbi:hypothetical protein CROQUDRAFT_94115 [Cronartium quercuum f. sp. fusiforme G11]|uniref:Uncharacterized protein n=1 Tax=Cronartium quercuum f. sp. fusiforme G11 TaxID=708437 RepID=A0A9P6NFY4_9BASI|nr:hypothetical protein CROQUDRAFT_94115 [Cronartium quercuum f. sp. fusiforme G11]
MDVDVNVGVPEKEDGMARNIILRLRRSAQPCPSGVVGLARLSWAKAAIVHLCLAPRDLFYPLQA